MAQPTEEELLWVGKPVVRLFDLRELLLFVPFGLLWNGALGYGLLGSLGNLGSASVEGLLAVFVPLLLVGLYVFPVRLIVKYLRVRTTCYAVTTRRLISTSRLPLRRSAEKGLGSIEDVAVSTRSRRDVGTVRAGPYRLFVPFPPLILGLKLYENTDLEAPAQISFLGGYPFAFYDVRAPEEVGRVILDARERYLLRGG